MSSAPIDLLGSRSIRVLKTSVSEIEIDSRKLVGRGRSSGLGEGKELLVKMERKYKLNKLALSASERDITEL